MHTLVFMAIARPSSGADHQRDDEGMRICAWLAKAQKKNLEQKIAQNQVTNWYKQYAKVALLEALLQDLQVVMRTG